MIYLRVVSYKVWDVDEGPWRPNCFIYLLFSVFFFPVYLGLNNFYYYVFQFANLFIHNI